MKRFYKFLSLFLVSLLGITGAVAQDFAQGDQLLTPEDVVGKRVVLFSNTTEGGLGWMCGTKLSATITNDCIYSFEATEGTVDGEILYLLKQESTGKYLQESEGGEDNAGLTTAKSQALRMTLMLAEELPDGATYTRNGASPKKQNLGDGCFVMTRADLDAQGGYTYVCGHVKEVHYYPYNDTNTWSIYTLAELSGRDLVDAYIDALCPNDPNEVYTVGNDPGQYPKDKVDALAAAYVAAASAPENISNEEARALCDALKAAYDALIASQNPMSEGYYFIYNESGRWMSTNTVQGYDFLWSIPNYEAPSPLDVSASKMIWKVSLTEEKDVYAIQNFYSGKRISREQNGAVKSDGANCFILTDDGTIGVRPDGEVNPPTYVFYADTNGWKSQFHAKFDNSGVMSWNSVDSPNNCFHFVKISNEEVEALLNSLEQQKLNDQLQAAYDEAQAAYSSGIVVAGAPLDTDFGTGLVSDPEAYFSSDDAGSKEPGAAPGLLCDNDFATYFHTDWGAAFAPSMERYHYIAVELPEALSGAISVKVARRGPTFNDFPTRFAIFGANEVDKADPNAAEWTLLGSSDINYCVAMTDEQMATVNTPEDRRGQKGIGTAGVAFDGSYKYFKFAAVKTLFNELDPRDNRGYFAISELNVWKGAIDEANSPINQVSAAVRSEMEKQLAAAKAQLAAGQATAETIAALQAVYEQFLVELPNPIRLNSAIESARQVASTAENNGVIGDGVAYYPQSAFDAFQAVIEEAVAFDTQGKTAAEINAMVDKVNNAVDAFNASLVLPEAGKYYYLRGRSNKVYNNTLTSLNALVYAANTQVAGSGSIRFTRPGNASDVENDFVDYLNGATVDMEQLLEDNMLEDASNINLEQMLQYVWYMEKAEAGKVVLRNLGTGLYLAPAEGEVRQSIEPAEISVVVNYPGCFVFDAGEGTQLNASSGGQVVTWAEVTDPNARWAFEEAAFIESSSAFWPVTAGVYQIVTLPFDVSESIDGTIYSLVGETADGQLALAEVRDENLPAGTPFIFKANAEEEIPAFPFAEFSYADGKSVSSIDDAAFSYEAKEANGLTGTLLESVEPADGLAYFNAKGSVVNTSGTTIGVNSGYFNGKHAKNVEATETLIPLGDVVIDGITENNVVVLPAQVNVYSINGMLLRQNVKAANATQGLPAGIYVVGGVKVLVK